MNWIEQGWRGPGISLILSPSCANSINLYKSFFPCTMRSMVLLIFQCPIFTPSCNTSYSCFCSQRDGRWICACNRWMHRCASPKKREITEHSKIKPVNPKGNQSWIFIHWKDWCWSWSSSTLATWCEEPTHWKRPWYWERLRAGGERGDRGWDGWMASLTQCTWVCTNSRRWRRTGKPGMLQSCWP